jgi:hypothetical protein
MKQRREPRGIPRNDYDDMLVEGALDVLPKAPINEKSPAIRLAAILDAMKDIPGEARDDILPRGLFQTWAIFSRYCLRNDVELAERSLSKKSPREVLRLFLQSQINMIRPPLKNKGPIAIILPYHLAAELLVSLTALDSGEARDLVTPAKAAPKAGGKRGKKGHGAAWSIKQLQHAAASWVFYLKGRGLTMDEARIEVGKHTGISPATLSRHYEKECPAAMRVSAKRAGELSLVIDRNPDYGLALDEPIDGDEYAEWEHKQDFPLDRFGIAYREKNNRHYGVNSSTRLNKG